jgi:hypothetical protein
MKKRIGISGKMTSGKTTVSEHLIKQYGYQRVSFATPIKWIVEVWFRDYCEQRDKWSSKQLLDKENQLYFFLAKVLLGDLGKASRVTDMLLEEIFPLYLDIDWSVEKNDKWRQCLQDVGGGRVRSEIDNEIWINYLMSILEPDGLYICDDLRYRNEYGIMDDNDFTLVRLHVSPEVQAERIKKNYGYIPPERLLHPSEVDLDDQEFPNIIDADQDLIWVLHDITNIIEEE